MKGIGPQGSEQEAGALARAIAADPANFVARFDLARELTALDRPEESLSELEALVRAGIDLPEVATLAGHVFVRLGRGEEAAASLRRAIQLRPEYVVAHTMLAALLPQLGQGDRAFDSFDMALEQCPSHPQLWIAAMQTAKAQRDYARLLDIAESAERRFGSAPMISGFTVDALAGAGRTDQAVALARRLTLEQPDDAAGQATLAYVLLKSGDYRDAEAAASAATRLAPLDQSGWALLGTAWRLLGDPREDWLCRYDELVIPVELELPPDLAVVLTSEHRAVASPADQSLRGGTQTAGALFQRAEPVIGEVARRIAAAVEDRLAQLTPEPDHPFLSRLRHPLAFSASWSVRLDGQGTHENHIHPAGWLSSAMYVSLPREVSAAAGGGALVFGVPESALGLDLAPRRIVQPREGLLVLFPSYLWHGTTPFRSEAARLTVAFDVVPVDNSRAGG